MRLLLDTNVVLDVMLKRHPHVTDSTKVMAAAEIGSVDGSLCATTVTTIHCLATKALGAKMAAKEIARLLSIFRIVSVTEAVLHTALQTKSPDYEDAVLFEAARALGVDGIASRNSKDFPKSVLAIYQPIDVVTLLGL